MMYKRRTVAVIGDGEQAAEAAMRAPVRGLGGGGDTKQEPEDPFLMGFNDEKW